MVVTAIVPFFGGTSSATHSLEETRLDYLKQTLDSLAALDVEALVFRARRDKTQLPDVPARIVEVDVDPIWLPRAACRFAQEDLSLPDGSLVLVTEADQVWHIEDEQVFDIPTDTQYLAPWRLDLVGPNGEMENPGSPTFKVDGKEYAVANGAHHIGDDPWGVVPVHGNQAAFSGAFVCTAEFFKRIKFRKRRMLPVEHATGFDANASGLCVKTSRVDRCWVDHLSPRDRWATSPS